MAEIRVLAEDPDTARAFRRFLAYLRPHRWILAAAMAVTVLSTGAIVAIAPVIGSGVDAAIARDPAGLWVSVAVLLALVFSRIALLYWSQLLLTLAGERVVRGLRELAVERLGGAPLRFVEAHRTGDLLRRATGEIADLALFVSSQLPHLLGIGITVVMTGIVLLAYSWLLASILVLLFIPAAVWVVRWFQRDAGAAFGRKAAAEATMTATFNETLAARETLQSAGRPGEWVGRFGRDNEALLQASNRTVAVQNRLEAFSLFEGLATAALLMLSGWLVSTDRISVGTVVVFVLATRNLFEGMLGLSRLIGELQGVRVGVARLMDLLAATRPETPGGTDGTVAALETDEQQLSGSLIERRYSADSLPARGDLVVSDLGFGYLVDREVLHGISVAFPAGDRAGLVGATGSGKTTLAKLLSGLYRPDRGVVRFGGVDLRDVGVADLRRCIVLVPQQVHMITGTVAENLALAPGEPDRAAMDRAVDRLGLRDWVDTLPDGLDTDVGSRGERMSAGERQLVGLVRAALVDPAVLLLDEATADLDPDTAGRLETAVERVCADRTLIVIAHRAATIDRLPRVVRLAQGRLEGEAHVPKPLV